MVKLSLIKKGCFTLLLVSFGFAYSQVKLVASGGYIVNPPNSYLVSGSSAANSVVLPTASAGILNTGYVVLAGGVNNTGGTFTSTAGTVILNGTSGQSISGNDYTSNTINGLVLTNPAGISLTGGTYITDSLSLQQGNFNINNQSLTLRSSAAITARVAPVYGTVSNGSTVTVERYFPGHRAWRLVSVPLVSSETINQAYQEGVYNTALSPWPAVNNNPNPGFGIHISGTQSPAGLGFDDTQLDNPSMLIYGGGNPETGTDIWTGIPNTLSRIDSRDAYLLFVRGSRATQLPLNTAAPADNTVIRPTGSLKIGDQVYSCPANSFTLIGNPYASTIDFHSITKNNVIDAFNVWDPNLTGQYGVGAYVTYTWNGSSYSYAPVPASAGLGQNIQSSQAFLVQNTSGSAGSVTISENHKITGSVSTIFTPMVEPSSFRTNLYNVNTGSPILVDGTLAIFGSNYNKEVDNVDAMKPTNIRETMSHRSAGRALGIDARPLVTQTDTLFYNINLYLQAYQFEFVPDRMDAPGLIGYLYDRYLNSYTTVSLTDTTRISFTVNSDTNSQSNTRFMVVFTQNGPLPVTVKELIAYKKNTGIQADWTLSQELNMDHYEVEKSLTGANFNRIGSVASTGNHSSDVTYSWFDTDPSLGANFYRIKMFDRNGRSAYTNIAKVIIDNGPPSIIVYPNPISGNNINLQFTNIPRGEYNYTVSNKLGQVVYKGVIDHTGGSSVRAIHIANSLSAGTYQLNIKDYTIQVIKQ
jgi:hypothetical protein